jgi:hypothetical protein
MYTGFITHRKDGTTGLVSHDRPHIGVTTPGNWVRGDTPILSLARRIKRGIVGNYHGEYVHRGLLERGVGQHLFIYHGTAPFWEPRIINSPDKSCSRGAFFGGVVEGTFFYLEPVK